MGCKYCLRQGLHGCVNTRDMEDWAITGDMECLYQLAKLGGGEKGLMYVVLNMGENRRNRNRSLTFEELRQANIARVNKFKDKNGQYVDCKSWALSKWSNAILGELGEAANVIKKIERGDFEIEEAKEKLGDELADVQTYLDIFCWALGLRLEDITIRKWNIVSERIGSDLRLGVLEEERG